MSAEPIHVMSERERYVRWCITHRVELISVPSHSIKEGLRCPMCKGRKRNGRRLVKRQRAFLLIDTKTKREIKCPVDADEGIEE